jgi:hypothetical protein
MTLFNKLKDLINPGSIIEPIFIKADGDAERQLNVLESLLDKVSEDTKQLIEADIRNLKQGIAGENNIAFELKNSHIPMLILHDLNLKYGDLSAQIDYLIIPKVGIIVLECKNLYGNIEVNSSGDFIRTLEYKGKYHKEGIYSPITQNTRHLEVMQKIRLASAKGMIEEIQIKNAFKNLYKPLVVLANPKTVINMKYAKKEVKEKIIRADQLINTIKSFVNENRDYQRSETDMYNIANFYLSHHVEEEKDYLAKYHLDLPKEEQKVEVVAVISLTSESLPIEETPIYKALKEYRLQKSREKEIKAYYIYNNAQMEEIIKAQPKSIEDLLKINGFDQVRVKEYGTDILEILEKHR